MFLYCVGSILHCLNVVFILGISLVPWHRRNNTKNIGIAYCSDWLVLNICHTVNSEPMQMFEIFWLIVDWGTVYILLCQKNKSILSITPKINQDLVFVFLEINTRIVIMFFLVGFHLVKHKRHRWLSNSNRYHKHNHRLLLNKEPQTQLCKSSLSYACLRGRKPTANQFKVYNPFITLTFEWNKHTNKTEIYA